MIEDSDKPDEKTTQELQPAVGARISEITAYYKLVTIKLDDGRSIVIDTCSCCGIFGSIEEA